MPVAPCVEQDQIRLLERASICAGCPVGHAQAAAVLLYAVARLLHGVNYGKLWEGRTLAIGALRGLGSPAERRAAKPVGHVRPHGGYGLDNPLSSGTEQGFTELGGSGKFCIRTFACWYSVQLVNYSILN